MGSKQLTSWDAAWGHKTPPRCRDCDGCPLPVQPHFDCTIRSLRRTSYAAACGPVKGYKKRTETGGTAARRDVEEMPKPRAWTPKEDALLRLYARLGKHGVAGHIEGRTAMAVQNRARQLGVSLLKRDVEPPAAAPEPEATQQPPAPDVPAQADQVIEGAMADEDVNADEPVEERACSECAPEPFTIVESDLRSGLAAKQHLPASAARLARRMCRVELDLEVFLRALGLPFALEVTDVWTEGPSVLGEVPRVMALLEGAGMPEVKQGDEIPIMDLVVRRLPPFKAEVTGR